MTRRATSKLGAYAALSGFGLVAALVLGRPEIVALTAPFLLTVGVGLALGASPRFTAQIEAGERAFGEGYGDAMANAMMQRRGSGYRKVDALMIRPNEDIAAVAAKHVRMGSVVSRAGGVMGPLIRRMSGAGGEREGDLLSYLLFDGEYASDLVAMGMRDADAMRQRIIEFFAV